MIQIQSKRTTFFSLITATCNSNVSLQYPPWIKCKGHAIDYNDRQSKKLLIVNHILLISTTGKVERLVKVKNSSHKILSANCQPSVSQLLVNSWLADCWPTVGWQLADRQPTVGWLLANCQLTVFVKFHAKVLANCWLPVSQPLANYGLTVGQLTVFITFQAKVLADCWSTVGDLLLTCQWTLMLGVKGWQPKGMQANLENSKLMWMLPHSGESWLEFTFETLN